MKTKKESKFNLEKFQIAKLNTLKSIKGGDGNADPITITETSRKCDKNLSTVFCGDPKNNNFN